MFSATEHGDFRCQQETHRAERPPLKAGSHYVVTAASPRSQANTAQMAALGSLRGCGCWEVDTGQQGLCNPGREGLAARLRPRKGDEPAVLSVGRRVSRDECNQQAQVWQGVGKSAPLAHAAGGRPRARTWAVQAEMPCQPHSHLQEPCSKHLDLPGGNQPLVCSSLPQKGQPGRTPYTIPVKLQLPRPPWPWGLLSLE